jgi:TP901 family phage tail tape measure protein
LSSKYQIIVEAIIQETEKQKESFEKSLKAPIFKDLTLTISKVALDEGAIKSLQDQVKNALKNVGFDLDKINKIKEQIEKPVEEGLKEGGAKGAQAIVQQLQTATTTIEQKFSSIKPLLSEGFKLNRVSAVLDEKDANIIKGYNVELEKTAGGFKQMASGFVSIEKESGDVLEILKATAVATANVSDKVASWNEKLKQISIRHADAFKTEDVKKAASAVNEEVKSFEKGASSLAKVDNSFAKLNTSVLEYESSLASANTHTQNFATNMGKVISKIALWGIGTSIIYGLKKQLSEMVEYVKDLNKEMTNIQIVTGATSATIRTLTKDFNDLAREMGATTLQIAQGATEWFRQGKSVEEVQKLLQSTLALSKLGNLESAQATEYLTSTLNGFKLEAEDAIGVVDKLIALDNAYATSAGELAEALQRTANSAQQAGFTFNELVSYIAIVSSVSRKSADSIGESFKTMSARLTNIKLGKLFEDDATTISDVEKALSLVNIRIRDTESSFRPMGEVFNEIAAKWKDMNELERSAVSGAIAGIRQREAFTTLMENFNEALKAQEIAANSSGLAMQRYQIYMDNAEAATNRFRAAWESLASSAFSDEFIIRITNLGTGILNIIEKIGVLKIVLVALYAFMYAKLFDPALFIQWASTLITGLTGVTTAVSATTLSIGGLTLSLKVLQGIVGVGIFVGLVAILYNVAKAVQEANKSIVDFKDEFVASSKEIVDQMTELDGLRNRYKQIAEQEEKSAEDKQELVNIIATLRDQYDMATESLDLYTDAIEGNSDAIDENIMAIDRKKIALAEEFVALNKQIKAQQELFMKTQTYSSAMLDIGEKRPVKGTQVFAGTPQEILDQIRKAIELEGDENGILKKRYDYWKAQIDAYYTLNDQYQANLDILNEALHIDAKRYVFLKYLGEDGLKLLEEEGEKAKTFAEQIKEASNAIQGLMGIYEEYIKTQELSTDQILNIISNYPEYLDMLTLENGKIVLNTAKIREMALAKIIAMKVELQHAISLDKTNIELRRQYLLLEALEDQVIASFNAIDQLTEKERELAEVERQNEIAEKAKQIQEEAYQDLLKMTIDMLKQKAQAEIDALQAELDAYKDIIDAQKESLDLMQKEHDYQKEKEQRNKKIADLEGELAELQFDTSEEGIARRLELEAQLAEEKDELNEMEYDHSIEQQQDALDKEYDQYEEYIDQKIDALEAYLDQTGLITQEAIQLLSNRTDAFYQSLIEWNRQFGSGVDQDVVGAWQRAFNAVIAYQIAAQQVGLIPGLPSPSPTTPGDQGDLTGERIKINSPTGSMVPLYSAPNATSLQSYLEEGRYFKIKEYKAGASAPYHITGQYYDAEGKAVDVDAWIKSRNVLFETYHEGLEKGAVGGVSDKYGEIFAKLLKGEFVINPQQIKDYVTKIFPKSVNAVVKEGAAGGTTIENFMPINVAGNLDQTVLPKIQEITKMAVRELNASIRKRGNFRNANTYSV